MSGGGGSHHAGWRYFFGIHMGLGRGPVDAILEVRVGDRRAWIGEVTSNATINIDAPNLFGGEDKEGGVQGPLEVMMGEPDQVASTGLQSMLGSVLPGFRGMCTLFFNGLISVNNPYPKPWKIRLRRILKGWDGDVFAPSLARVPAGSGDESAVAYTTTLAHYPLTSNTNPAPGASVPTFETIYVFGGPGALPTFTDDGMRQGNINDFDVAQADFRFGIAAENISIPEGDTIAVSYVFGDFEFIPVLPALEEIDVYLNIRFSYGLFESASIPFSIVLSVLFGYFQGEYQHYTACSTTEGAEPPVALGRLDHMRVTGKYNRNARIATLFINETQIISFRTPEIPADYVLKEASFQGRTRMTGIENTTGWRIRDVGAAVSGVNGGKSMNGAHIIYEALTNREWGRGLSRTRLNEASFLSAAGTLYSEQFGLCIKWTRQDSIENFIQSVLDHIGANLYEHRRSGLITLKLIRADYPTEGFGVGAVPSFDNESGLLEIRDMSVGSPGRGVNTVTVIWHDTATDQDRAVTVKNNAAIRMAGGAVNAARKEYLGIPYAALATRIAQRDLRAASVNLRRMTIVLRWDSLVDPLGVADDITIHPGDVIRIRDTERMIPWMFVRVGRVEYGSPQDSTLVLDVIQDVFTIPSSSFASDVPNTWEPPNTKPCIDQQRVFEVPYFLMSSRMTPADLDYVPDDGGFLGVLNSKGKATNVGIQIAVRRSASTPDDQPENDDYVCE